MSELTLTASSCNNLSELFSRDPLKLSEQDLDLIISTMRLARSEWAQAETKAKAEGKAVRSRVATAPKMSAEQALNLSLDDLGISL